MTDTGNESSGSKLVLLGAIPIQEGGRHVRRVLGREHGRGLDRGDGIKGATNNSDTHGAASEDTDCWFADSHCKNGGGGGGIECRNVRVSEGGNKEIREKDL